MKCSCPHCHEAIDIGNPWNMLCEEPIPCMLCGEFVELECEESEDSMSFWLVIPPSPEGRTMKGR